MRPLLDKIGKFTLIFFLASGIVFLSFYYNSDKTWFHFKVLSVFYKYEKIALLINILLIIQFAFTKKPTKLSMIIFRITSYYFGFLLWCSSVSFSYMVLGLKALNVGLLFLGIGVIPVAFYGLISKGSIVLVHFIMLVIFSFVFYKLSNYFCSKIDGVNSMNKTI